MFKIFPCLGMSEEHLNSRKPINSRVVIQWELIKKIRSGNIIERSVIQISRSQTRIWLSPFTDNHSYPILVPIRNDGIRRKPAKDYMSIMTKKIDQHPARWLKHHHRMTSVAPQTATEIQTEETKECKQLNIVSNMSIKNARRSA